MLRRLRERAGRTIRLELPFDDVMEFALALLALSPEELDELGWSFADRKRLLNHFLRSGKAAQEVDRAKLGTTPLPLTLPARDLVQLQRFATRQLPFHATNAAMLDRVGRVLSGCVGSGGTA
jgi:hypothetical protein